MFHQQLQGVSKNKKNSGYSSRSKAQQAAKVNNVVTKDQNATNKLKEATPKKDKKAASQTPAAARYIIVIFTIKATFYLAQLVKNLYL